MRVMVFLLALLCVSFCISVRAAQTATPSASGQDALLSKLPAELRDVGASLLNSTDDGARLRLVDNLARRGGNNTAEFLIALLERDPSVTFRVGVVSRLGALSHPDIRAALERTVLNDKAINVSLAALESLRMGEMRHLRELLQKRIESSRSVSDEDEKRRLAAEDERWISLVRGAMLPAFMRQPPPVFSLKDSRRSVRVLAFGDFGTGSPEQKRVASAMLQYHKKSPFDFAITLGDNFYEVGMESPEDARWQSQWEELYKPLGIKFYATLGNADWDQPDSPAAQILYSNKSSTWRMPAPYYTFTAGPVQFFALDTNEISEAQLRWLAEELGKSGAKWKVVHGHHPIYAEGFLGDSPRLIARLLPLLKGKVDIYLAGHDHDLQHLKPEDGLHFFISGGGGAGIHPIRPGPRSLLAKGSYGFMVIDADSTRLKVTFIGSDHTALYHYTLTKPTDQ